MAADGNDNVIDLFSWETESFEYFLRHFRAHALMFIKVNAAGLRVE
jgi:hypothetical protein